MHPAGEEQGRGRRGERDRGLPERQPRQRGARIDRGGELLWSPPSCVRLGGAPRGRSRAPSENAVAALRGESGGELLTPIEDGDELRIGRTRLLFDESTDEKEISISVSEGDRDEKPTHAVRLDETSTSQLTRVMTSAVRELVSHRSTTEILRSPQV